MANYSLLCLEDHQNHQKQTSSLQNSENYEVEPETRINGPEGEEKMFNQKKHKLEEANGDEIDTIADVHFPLPVHIALRIFTLLPIPCIARLRLVCRSWKALLSSPSFLCSLHEIALKEEPDMMINHKSRIVKKQNSSQSRRRSTEWWFVMAASRPGTKRSTQGLLKPDEQVLAMVAFSPNVGPWSAFRLPAGFDFLQLNIASSQSTVPSVVNMLIASAGGLICAVVKGEASIIKAASRPPTNPSSLHDIIVFNCLTGASRCLPRPSRLTNGLISSCAISMSVQDETYTIILSDLKYKDMEIFDSRTGAWRAGSGIRTCGVLSSPTTSDRDQAAAAMADLIMSDLLVYKKNEIAAYEGKTNRWTKVEVQLPRLAGMELMQSTIAKSKGRLLLVACLMQEKTSMQGFGIWQLQLQLHQANSPMSPFTWTPIGRTPSHVLSMAFDHTRFDSPTFYDCRVIGHPLSDSLCMTGAHYSIGSCGGTQFWPPLIYNVSLDEWQLLPPANLSSNYLCLFHFEPRYNAIV